MRRNDGFEWIKASGPGPITRFCQWAMESFWRYVFVCIGSGVAVVSVAILIAAVIVALLEAP